MFYLFVKAALSGIIVAATSEIARRYPIWGGLVAALPMTSLLAFVWLWRDTHDPHQVASLATSIFWFILPSLALFIGFPWLLRSGLGFWVALAIATVGMVAVYAGWFWAAPRLGIKL